jgi:glycosyltransferase
MISIITATYNSEATLRDCLASVAAQTLEAEHIIVDGRSTDGTMELVRAYPHAAHRVLSEPDSGMYDAMNKGIGRATGDVVGILNSDDYYASPRVLEWVAQAFRDPAVDACYGDLVYVDAREAGRVVRYWRAGRFERRSMLWGWMPPHPTFFVRRSVYERYGAFNLDLGSAADYEIMLRFLLKHSLSATYIPRVLVKMRTGGASNVSIRARLRANRMDRRAWRVNGLRPYPWTLWAKPLRKLSQWVAREREDEAGTS